MVSMEVFFQHVKDKELSTSLIKSSP